MANTPYKKIASLLQGTLAKMTDAGSYYDAASMGNIALGMLSLVEDEDLRFLSKVAFDAHGTATSNKELYHTYKGTITTMASFCEQKASQSNEQ